MDLQDIIHHEVELEIRRLFITKPAIIPFLLKHERRKLFETNLRREIFGAEMRWGPKMDRGRVNKLVQAGTHIFAHAAIETQILNLMSPAERARREKEAGREKSAAEWFQDEQKELFSTKISKSTYIPDAKEEEAGTPAET